MQNNTHQCTPKPQPPRCGHTLNEHLATLPALQQAAGSYPALHEWLQQMLHNAASNGGQDVTVRWYASRAQGYLLGLGACGKGVCSAMVDLGIYASRLAPEQTQ